MSLDNILLIPGLDWTPRNLFRPGDNGLWQDMSNFGTLRQLSTGSTLVSSVGDPIGYIADSGPRGHLTTQTTNGKRPILSRTPEGGVRQLLQWSEDLTNAVWAKTRTSVLSGQTDSNGSLTAVKAIPDNNDGTHIIMQVVDLSGLGGFVITIEAKQAEYGRFRINSATSASGYASFNLLDGSVTTGGTNIASGSITELQDGWFRCSAFFSAQDGTAKQFVLEDNDGNVTFIGDNTSGILLAFPQVELGTTATNYQKATTRFDITEAGKRDCWSFGYDGIDDAMSTPSSVDMSGSDEMTVCVGLRKLSDASQGIVIETANSITIAGTVGINAPAGAGLSSADYAYQSNGTALATAVAANGTFDAPVSNVISGVSKRTSDIARLRVNGVQINESTTDQGDGNYGNNRIYFGARGEASLFYQGLIYQVVIINRLLNDYELAKLEQFVARKMGITL